MQFPNAPVDLEDPMTDVGMYSGMLSVWMAQLTGLMYMSSVIKTYDLHGINENKGCEYLP